MAWLYCGDVSEIALRLYEAGDRWTCPASGDDLRPSADDNMREDREFGAILHDGDTQTCAPFWSGDAFFHRLHFVVWNLRQTSYRMKLTISGNNLR